MFWLKFRTARLESVTRRSIPKKHNRRCILAILFRHACCERGVSLLESLKLDTDYFVNERLLAIAESDISLYFAYRRCPAAARA